MRKIKDLYELGDMSKEEYLQKREAIQKELRSLTPPEEARNLDKLAEFLVNVAEAWGVADQEHRNKLARCLFEEVWVKDKQVVAVKPRPEFEPFFNLNYEEFITRNNEGATPGGFEPPISTVTGWHVCPLHHGAILVQGIWGLVDKSFTNAKSISSDTLCQASVLIVLAWETQ